MTQQSAEERINTLEQEVATLKQQLNQLLTERRHFDELRTEIRSVGRTVAEFSAREQGHESYVQARFGVMEYDLKGIDGDIKSLQTGQQELREGMQTLLGGQAALQASQDQLLTILTGKPKTND